jgi:hypothetical protein
MRNLIVLAAIAAAAPTALHSQTAADTSAIRETALNYVEGWYSGNADRMTSALHPELVKRIVRIDSAGHASVQQMGATALIAGARAGYGKQTPADRQRKDVKILDIFGNTASARADMADWIDYMHLAKVDGRWVIVNVL